MKRYLLAVFLLVFAFSGAPGAPPKAPQTQNKKKAPCKPNLAKCPDEGCGGKDIDPELNKRKNIRSDDHDATPHTLAWMKKLGNPDEFAKGETREELTGLGEGDKISVVAYVLVVRKGSAESCNCGLTSAAETDNHMVLVSKSTISKFPLAGSADSKVILHKREEESETAEFTPRVRLQHPGFTRAKLQPLINSAKEQALLVRVTGLLLFDSEHFLGRPLVRVNNWEIHPVLKLEFCTTGATCKANSDSGWKSLDDLN
jgi:hypothetical protein